jgi:hypothetical protein
LYKNVDGNLQYDPVITLLLAKEKTAQASCKAINAPLLVFIFLPEKTPQCLSRPYGDGAYPLN